MASVVADGGVPEDFKELLGGDDRLKDLVGVIGSELGGGFEGGDAVLIDLVLLQCGIHGSERRKRLLHLLEKKGFQKFVKP